MIEVSPSKLLKDFEDFVNLGTLPPGETEPREFCRAILALLHKTVPHYLIDFG